MPATKPFRNQRTRFHNYSPPYAEKTLDNPRGYFPSRKNGRKVSFWDLRELKFITLAEASPSILSYEERPELVTMRHGPSWYRYVPHFLVVMRSGPAFVELSHSGKPATVRQERVATLARAKFAVDRHRFVELSHAEVRPRPGQANPGLLVRYLSTAVTEEQSLQVRDVLAGGGATIRDVEAASGASMARILSMVLAGDLEMTGCDAITRDSVVAVPGRGAAR